VSFTPFLFLLVTEFLITRCIGVELYSGHYIQKELQNVFAIAFSICGRIMCKSRISVCISV